MTTPALPNDARDNRLLTGFALLFALIALSYVVISTYNPARSPEPVPPTSASTTTKAVAVAPPRVPTPEELAAPHLAWAQRESGERLYQELIPIEDFFRDAKRNAPTFSKAALSWSSKWRLMADYVPGTKGGRHENYLRTEFEKTLFTPAQLEQVVTRSIRGYQLQLESIENEMLVRIRAGARDFPDSYKLAAITKDELQANYEQAITRVIAKSQSDFARSAGGEVVSLIAGEVLTQVAIRLGISAGILGTGAAASPYTLGLGIVVGVIVDQLVTWAYDWAADPKAELTRELNKKFDEIRGLIIDGPPAKDGKKEPGLREKLRTYAEQRGVIRRQAVLEMLEARMKSNPP
jgi:hypothetical protein